jgi:arsenate reductase
VDKILILCTHNSVRSQLAEAIFRHLGDEKIEVKSAGSNPCGANPDVFKVLEENGINSEGLYSKNVLDFINERFNYVITVCDRMKQTCPVFIGEYKKAHWSIEDPGLVQGTEDEIFSAFRNTRNILKALIIDFLQVPLNKAKLKCPFCGFIQEVEIPDDKCLAFYNCVNCEEMISALKGNCCVICGYSDKVCKEFYNQVMEKYLT